MMKVLTVFCFLVAAVAVVPVAPTPALAQPAPAATEAPGIAARAEPMSEGAAGALAIAHVRKNHALLGVDRADLNWLRVTDVIRSSGGVTNVHLQQQFGGFDVFGAASNVTIGSDGYVLSVGNRFVPGVSKLRPVSNPAKNVVEAAAAAVEALELRQSKPITNVSPAQGLRTPTVGGRPEIVVSDGGISRENIPARLVLQPVDDGLRLAWEFQIQEVGSEAFWQIRVDADTGEELGRNSLVDPDSYDVFPAPGMSPDEVAQTTETNPADPVASPFGWHDVDGLVGPEYTITKGNNVDAYADVDADNIPDPGQPDGGATLDFNSTFDPALTPVENSDALLTNLFYWNNYVHDVLYAYGFDENNGNFQVNNYGRGGLGGDAVMAEALDGFTQNNSSFATPPDGSPPRMNLHVFTGPDPDRDPSVDNGIVIHEYAHGLTNRLTGGPANVACLDNFEQAGEGWSDYFALMLTMDPSDAGVDARPFGTYAAGQLPTGPGFRDFPYSTDMAVNPLTYDSIKDTSVPHGIGSVFATMLWEMTWALNDRDGITPDLINGVGGNVTAMQLVIDGLKLQPCSPGFVDARDAILLADLTNNAGANECLIWSAFATRGLGFGAFQGSSDNRLDGIEAFDLPPQCAPLALTVSVSPDPALNSDNLTYTLVATNNTIGPLTNVVATGTVPAGSTYVDGSATCAGSAQGAVVTFPVGGLGPAASAICQYTVKLPAGPGTVTLLDDGFESSLGNWTLSHATGSDDWSVSTTAPHGPVASVFADNVAVLSDQFLTLNVPIPATNLTKLRFWHQYLTEAAFDGGVVEVSTDGTNWIDLGPHFIQNGYSQTLSAGTSPLAGRDAFTGNSSGYLETIADLSSFAGSDVQIRFRFATDSNTGRDGWHVDDLTIADEVLITQTSTITSAEEPGVSIDTSTVAITPSCAERFITVNIGAGDSPTSGDDVILGTPGDDVIDGLGGDDVICGQAGHDHLTGGSGRDIIFGGEGNDTIHGGDDGDQLIGDAGDDTIHGDGDHDYINGGPGNNSLFGDGGNDIIDGGPDNDTITGGDNDPVEYDPDGPGGNPAVIISGWDLVLGHGGDDTLIGDDPGAVMQLAANGDFAGGAGQDYLWGGPGQDSYDGGDGHDWLEGAGGSEGEQMDGGPGNDIILGHDGADTLIGGSGSDYLWGGEGIDAYHGGDDRDTLDGFDVEGAGEIMRGGDGQDDILGWGGDDTLIGGAGSDYLWGGEGIDDYDGGDDRDTLDGFDVEGAGEIMRGGDGQDDILGWGGDDTLIGGDGSDYLWGGEGIDDYDGGDDRDTLDGFDVEGAGEIMRGGDGQDDILGHGGDDTLLGGDGGDYLWGGDGIDHCDPGSPGPPDDFLEDCET